MNTLIATLIWLASPSIQASVNQATSTQNFPIQEYEAHYDIKYFGITAGESVHRLHQRKDGIYHFESRTNPILKFLPYSYVESSDFIWENGNIIPQNYFYDIQEGKRSKKGNVTFDWVAKVVANNVSPKPWHKPLPDNIQDKVTQVLRLRYDLIQGNTDLVYTVAEDDEIKPYAFRILGEEKIASAIGTFTAIKVEHVHRKGHRTNTWFAKELNYLPIKLNQIRKGRVVGTGEISALKHI
tara:strand:+ start:91253 stop:91972 length:720 start_codon:yes stop_codon:yes gene_type:complete